MRLVGRLPRASLDDERMVRLAWPPFDVLVARVDGVPCAIEDACNHAGASLSEGERSGRCVSCPMHGYVFELTTGQLLQPRGLCSDQRRFVVSEDREEISVWDPGPPVTVRLP
jgi:nitrite reductase/ring-hydroxylating ferredoxin subunit